MLKKRLIFILYYDAGHFYLSRNFRLQRVGDARWLVDKFRFKAIGRFIDELVILDVSRQPGTARCAGPVFSDAVAYLMRQTLVPLTMGGGLASMADAERCFQLGADKILFNSAVLCDPGLIRDCVARFGAQAVIGALDVLPEAGGYVTRVGNGQQPGLGLAEHLQRTAALGVGEVLVNSIERDGTGMGFDLALIDRCLGLQVPLIVAGGAGKPEHFGQVLRLPEVQAAATGNLFNFIGKGFEQVRHFLLDQQLPVRAAGNPRLPVTALAPSEATS